MKKTVFIIGCLSMLFFSACQKEMSDNFTAYTGNPLNDTVWLRNVTTTIIKFTFTTNDCGLI